MSQRDQVRGARCLVCKRLLPASHVRGRRQLYCSDHCAQTGQRWQQTQTGKVSGRAQRRHRVGTGGRSAPRKGQGRHGQGTVTHKSFDLEGGDEGVA